MAIFHSKMLVHQGVHRKFQKPGLFLSTSGDFLWNPGNPQQHCGEATRGPCRAPCFLARDSSSDHGIRSDLSTLKTSSAWWLTYPSAKHENQWEGWHPIYSYDYIVILLLWLVTIVCILDIVTLHNHLAGGWPTPRKNDGVRQLGW